MAKPEQALHDLRAQIDAVDEQLILLLAERAGLARKIGQVKAELRKTENKTLCLTATEKKDEEKNSEGNKRQLIYDQHREGQVIKKISQLALDMQLDEKFCTELYRQIINYCTQVQLQDRQ